MLTTLRYLIISCERIPVKPCKAINAALLLGLTSLLCLPASAETTLKVSHAWVREAPPGARVQAGYMELHNNSQKDIKIIAINSPGFASIEMHRLYSQNGMMRMQQQDALTIPANSVLRLEPGGFHLMLFNPVSYLNSGDTVRFTLITQSAAQIEVTANVKTDNGS